MNKAVKLEVEKIIEECSLCCSVNNFRDKAHFKWVSNNSFWPWISTNWELSEGFIREFQDKLDWNNLSHHQNFSEDFIYDFEDKLDINMLIERKLITRNRLNILKKINVIDSRFEILDL